MTTPPLTDVEVRVLGSLIEKEVTTPDTYPLSLNALLAACNQISNREPVMQLEEDAVTQAIVSLRRRSLVRAIQPSGSRVTKYQQLLSEALSLDARELAVLDVLMLRGHQTAGEVNTRASRLAEFADLSQVETTLEALIVRQPESLVARLPRRPGQKEVRYAHLLSGEVSASDFSDTASSSAPTRIAEAPLDLTSLQRSVDELRADLAALRTEFEEFRSQFR